jgi:2'-5' RNA ligase
MPADYEQEHEMSQTLFAELLPAPRPTPTDRLFFAVLLGPDVGALATEEAYQIRGQNRLKGWPIEPERSHITLYSLGDYNGLPRGLVMAALEAGARVRTPSFETEFDRAGSFRRNGRARPLVLRGNDEALASLVAFQKDLGAAMTDVGLAPFVARTFTPHVTLLYDKLTLDERPIQPIRWRVREFVLIHSLLGQTRYVILGRWPLPEDTQRN